jgi:hypothetical protein
VAGVGALLFAEATAVVALAALGSRPPFAVPAAGLRAWLRDTDPVDAVAAVTRVVALAMATWLLVSTLVYVLLRVTRASAAAMVVARGLVGPVQLLVDRAFVAAVTSGSVMLAASSAALAQTTPAPVSSPPAVTATVAPPPSVRTGRGAPLAALPGRATTATPTTSTATAARPVPTSTVALAPTAGTPPKVPRPTVTASTQVVVAGDNLWSISARHLAAARGVAPASLAPAEIAPYWRQVCDANRDTIASGDVNLIQPGEAVELPTPPP